MIQLCKFRLLRVNVYLQVLYFCKLSNGLYSSICKEYVLFFPRFFSPFLHPYNLFHRPKFSCCLCKLQSKPRLLLLLFYNNATFRLVQLPLYTVYYSFFLLLLVFFFLVLTFPLLFSLFLLLLIPLFLLLLLLFPLPLLLSALFFWHKFLPNLTHLRCSLLKIYLLP